jgi:hypothetical protein
MKGLIYFIGSMLFWVSCKLPINDSKDDLMKLVYKDQKLYYDRYIGDNPDYNSIVSFGSKGRNELYQKHGVQPSLLKDFIILEGFSSGWGDYRGLLMSDRESYFYRNNASDKWELRLVRLDSDIEKETGIKKVVIDRVRSWDTLYINNRKKQLGSSVLDGFVFIATKVKNDAGHNPQIETIAFDEFAP